MTNFITNEIMYVFRYLPIDQESETAVPVYIKFVTEIRHGKHDSAVMLPEEEEVCSNIYIRDYK